MLFPAIRWADDTGFSHESEAIERALDQGVGGFILFGGEADEVRELVAELRGRSAHPLLIGADLERGAGQQFRGATSLPPVAALGSLRDLEVARRAGELTAREARALGVDWVYAPVADLDIEPRNPIVGTRAFGSDPESVAKLVVAWVEGCRDGGAMACAKHFPGHGRTTSDSHLGLPQVGVTARELEVDLLPFREAIGAGVDSIMTAHVAYPGLDPSGAPATLSRPIVGGLLREELGFDGLVVTDALIMEGVLGSGRGEAAAAVAAVAAGCDVLLYPRDSVAVAAALDAALGGELEEGRVAEAISRLDRAAAWLAQSAKVPGSEVGLEGDRRWAEEVAVRAVRVVRGDEAAARKGRGASIELITIDDDLGGPYAPPSRDAFPEALRAGGVGVETRESGGEGGEGGEIVVALYADIRGWKGRPGLSAGAVQRLERIAAAGRGGVVVLFGHPRLAGEVPAGFDAVVTAWGGEALMQRACARWLLGDSPSRYESGGSATATIDTRG